MKPRIVASLYLFMPVGLMAQTSLTYTENSLRTCDSNNYREVQLSDPGNAGAGQTWDFSKTQDTEKNSASIIRDALLPKMKGVNDYNLLLTENGYDYFMNSSEKGLEELGYENNEQKLVLRYSDPVVKMKYPFSYGDHFTDHFVGVAWYNESSTIDLSGDITVAADGYGKLILQDQVIDGALRVKSVKKGLQINMCGTNDFNITKYSWYAPGSRYPVLNLNIIAYSLNGGAPVITKTASVNTQQFSVKSAVLGTDLLAQTKAAAAIAEKQEVKVVVSPNPFTEKLKYEYVLTEPMNVSVEVYDVSGKSFGSLVSNQLQQSGYQNGELSASAYGLISGVYFMRFTFNKQVVICKVVKF